MGRIHPTPPGPRGAWFVGNLTEYERDRPRFLLELAANYGGVARFSRNVSFVEASSLVEILLLDRSNQLSRIHNFLGEEVTEANTELWMRGRRASMSSLKHLEGQLFESVQRCFRRELDGVHGVVDASEFFERITRRSIAETCFGPRASTAVELAAQNFLDSLLPISASPIRPPDNLRGSKTWRARRAERLFRQEIATEVARCQVTGDGLAAALVAQLGRDLTERMLVSIVLAGHGVPARSMAWITYLLASNPAASTRLQTEVAQVDEWPRDFRHLVDTFPYTGAVIREALRLFPPTWLLGRRVDSTFRLGDYKLDAGHIVLFSSYVTGRNEENFANPNHFRPSRWLDESSTSARMGAYFPFGAGARSCMGRRIAETELMLLTALLHRDANHHVVGQKAVRLDSRRSLVPAGLQMDLRPRID